MRRSARFLSLMVVVLLTGSGRVTGADLMEPLDRGFSEVDLFWFGGDERFDAGSQLTAGFGLPCGFSLWVGGEYVNGGPLQGGLNLMWTSELAPAMDLDLWVEAGIRSTRPEAELGQANWTLACEWSLEAGGVTPYLRLGRSDDGSRDWIHMLGGVEIPLGCVDLHVELSSEEPPGGPWPWHAAVGPNVFLASWVEMQPEISVVRDRSTGESHWAASLGFVVDPRPILRGGGM